MRTNPIGSGSQNNIARKNGRGCDSPSHVISCHLQSRWQLRSEKHVYDYRLPHLPNLEMAACLSRSVSTLPPSYLDQHQKSSLHTSCSSGPTTTTFPPTHQDLSRYLTSTQLMTEHWPPQIRTSSPYHVRLRLYFHHIKPTEFYLLVIPGVSSTAKKRSNLYTNSSERMRLFGKFSVSRWKPHVIMAQTYEQVERQKLGTVQNPLFELLMMGEIAHA